MICIGYINKLYNSKAVYKNQIAVDSQSRVERTILDIGVNKPLPS